MRAVNLLPADLRGAVKAPASVTPAPEDRGGSSGAFVALGALALCVLGLAGYVLTTNSIKQRESDLAALETRSAAVTAEVARLKPYADFQSMATARIATVRDLASRRFDWEQSLRDLSRALPEDVSVRQLVGSVAGGGGGGGSSIRGAIEAPAIELTGCTADQPSVARMLARLRAVNGVTRVSLSNATKTATQADSGAAPSTTGGTPTGCEGKGKGDPADFSIVVFFENDAAAAADATAAAAPTTAAAGAGTTPTSAPGTTPAPAATPTPAAPTTEPAGSGTSVPTSTEND
jgi:Tfp pilus assembly protein PilN